MQFHIGGNGVFQPPEPEQKYYRDHFRHEHIQIQGGYFVKKGKIEDYKSFIEK